MPQARQMIKSFLINKASEKLLTYTELTNTAYKPNWHHRVIINYLEQVARGEINRLMILMPPRHGKSELSSIRLPAWYLGRNPDKKVIFSSYSDQFAGYFGKHTRNLCQTPVHKLAFPECRIRADSSSAQLWETEAGGKYVAVGRGGAVTGHGAHLLILDDMIKNSQESYSDTIRETVWDYYRTTLLTRLEDNGSILIVNTRWHADDLVGRILEEEGDKWTVIRMPAIAEYDMNFDGYIYKAGEVLWPSKFPLDVINDRKAELGSHFEPIYQQNPQAQEGNIFKHKYWKRAYTVPGKILSVIQSWDTGYKKGDDNSYSACTTWVETENCYWLVHAWWGKVSFPELKRKAVELYQNPTINQTYGRPNQVLVEDKASGQSLVDELEEDTTLPVKRIQPEGDKVARAHIVSPAFETGNVGILEGKVWTVDDGKEVTSKDVIDICAKFPGVKNKDIVDSITQAVQHLRHGNNFKYTYHYASNGKRKSIFEREREAKNGGNGG